MDAVATVRRLSAERSVTLRFILRLYRASVEDGIFEQAITTADWTKMMIIPVTADPDNQRYQSFAEWASEEYGMQIGLPRFHIVHSWAASAKSLVIGAAKAANWDGPEPESVTQLLDEVWHLNNRPGNLDVQFFICPFSVNQHTVNKLRPDDNHAPEPFPDGHPLCEIDKFPEIAQAICGANPQANMVLVLDNGRTALKRTFCLEEVHHAQMNFSDQLRLINALGSIQADVVDGETAGAYNPMAKARIDERIRQAPGGFQAFNRALQRLLDDAVRSGRDRFRARLGHAPRAPVQPQPVRQPPEGPPLTIWGRIRINISWVVMLIGEGVRAVSEKILTTLQYITQKAGEVIWRVAWGRPGSIHLWVAAECQDRETFRKARVHLEVAQMTGHLQTKMTQALSGLLLNEFLRGWIAACDEHGPVKGQPFGKKRGPVKSHVGVEVFPFSCQYEAHADDVPIGTFRCSILKERLRQVEDGRWQLVDGPWLGRKTSLESADDSETMSVSFVLQGDHKLFQELCPRHVSSPSANARLLAIGGIGGIGGVGAAIAPGYSDSLLVVAAIAFVAFYVAFYGTRLAGSSRSGSSWFGRTSHKVDSFEVRSIWETWDAPRLASFDATRAKRARIAY